VLTQLANQFALFDTGKAFTCNANSFLDISLLSCNNNCPTTYTVFPGVTYDNTKATKGYCNYPCDMIVLATCPYTQAQILGMDTNYNTMCNTGYIDQNYKCVTNSNSLQCKS